MDCKLPYKDLSLFIIQTAEYASGGFSFIIVLTTSVGTLRSRSWQRALFLFLKLNRGNSFVALVLVSSDETYYNTESVNTKRPFTQQKNRVRTRQE